MVKLFLSTPCYGGLCLEKYMKSIVNLQMLLMREGVQLMLDTTENESLVHRARNVSIGRFMQKTDADFFMFIDADVEFDAQSVLRLLNSGHEVSVAVYPKKVVMWDQAREAAENGDERNMALISSSLVANIGATKRSVVNGFVEVLDGPTGFMMISREALTRMHEHYPELNCKNDHQNRDFDEYCAIFDCMIDPDSKRYYPKITPFVEDGSRWEVKYTRIAIPH